MTQDWRTLRSLLRTLGDLGEELHPGTDPDSDVLVFRQVETASRDAGRLAGDLATDHANLAAENNIPHPTSDGGRHER
ncbi:hypothetical protein EDD99_4381 [Streptomyces sp. 846.5]|nr:hypothetical protein [Streptomyces sp. 846.5]TDU05845.1 hypothetical protein EDD99_4381 [Streptomyces sp. 846.5]